MRILEPDGCRIGFDGDRGGPLQRRQSGDRELGNNGGAGPSQSCRRLGDLAWRIPSVKWLGSNTGAAIVLASPQRGCSTSRHCKHAGHSHLNSSFHPNPGH